MCLNWNDLPTQSHVQINFTTIYNIYIVLITFTDKKIIILGEVY